MFVLDFGPLTSDPHPPTDGIELVVYVEATFALRLGDEVVYEEPGFTVVELAVALRRWLHRPARDREDFEFESMDAEEVGFVWIRREGAGWRVGSIRQERAVMDVWTSDDVEDAVADFETRLAGQIGTAFGEPMRALFWELGRGTSV